MEKQARIQQKEAFGAPRKKSTRKSNTANLVPAPKGSSKKKKRIGQGPGSGMGKTSTRGQKGQKARASSMRRGFEGGQMPLHRRLPKRGFNSFTHKDFQPVNLRDLLKYQFAGEITPDILEKKGIIKDQAGLIKILGTGDVSVSMTIIADGCSKSAKEKIEKAGGSIKLREKAKAQ